jgi:hypothetical protein
MLRLKLREFNPDWISLHYVPYAFDNKGLPRQLTHCLGSLGIGAQWHVMAHELWVDPQLRFSNRVLSFIQKFLFKSLITTLSPRLIHTSNAYYQKLLSDLYLNSSVLPMYGSIPIISPEKLSRTTHQGWRFILFGGILPDWDPFPLLHAIVAIAHQQSIQQIEFLSVGSSGNHGVKLWKNLAAVFSEMALFKQLGHLTSPDLSRWMHQSDFGITTSPSHLLGKSSTVASMMEHGLPVIVSRLEKKDGPWHEYLQADRRFVLFDQNFEQTFLSAHKYPQNEQLLATADQFVRSLEESI